MEAIKKAGPERPAFPDILKWELFLPGIFGICNLIKNFRDAQLEVEFAISNFLECDIHVGHARIGSDHGLVALSKLTDTLGNHVDEDVWVFDLFECLVKIDIIHRIIWEGLEAGP